MSSPSTVYLPGVSVVICCYNSSKRLPDTLKHLALQQFPRNPGLQWEVIVVDNASTDDTADAAAREWSKYQTAAPLRVLKQPIPGTGHARDMGMAAVQYEHLLFCDDDNWLSEDYIDTAYGIMKANKSIAGLGGCGIANCEAPPPPWFEELKAAYAVGGQGPDPHGKITMERGFIYTAGGMFRKEAIDDIVNNGYEKLLTGRTAKSMGAGEDVELCYALILNGKEIYYDERLQFQHLMPAGRITWSYFKRLNHGFGITFPYLMPYKMLMLKQHSRYKRGISWLFITAIYLLAQDLSLRLPKAVSRKSYHRWRADLENHWGFLTSLIHNRRTVRQIFKTLPQQAWILPEYKAGIA